MNDMPAEQAPVVSVVIPVFNEQACLPELLRRCLAAGAATGLPFEIVLVDDGSSDQSRPFIETSSAAHPNQVVGVLLNRNYGQHAAVMAGLEHSRGEIVVTLDADLQNPPEEIPRLVAQIREGFDVVGTVRQNRQDTLFRRLSSALVNKIVQTSTGVLMHDYGCMLRAYRQPIVRAMLQCHERSTFIPILANSFARTTTEIEVGHAQRDAGTSKYNLWKLISLQFDLLTSITTFPLRRRGAHFAPGHGLRRFPFSDAPDSRLGMGGARRVYAFCSTVHLRGSAVYRVGPARRIPGARVL